MDSIVFRISKSTLSDGRYTNASVHAVGGTLARVGEYQKYMVDIIAHALTHTSGVLVDNEKFTYNFPFKMA